MKKPLLILLLLLLPFALASDMSVDSITFSNNTPFINETFTTSITISSDSNGSGILKIRENTNDLNTTFFLINSETKTFDYNHSFSTSKDYNIIAVLENIAFSDGNTDSDNNNNLKSKSLHVGKGLDLTITSITLSTMNPQPSENVTASITVKNVGDITQVNSASLTLVFDATTITSTTFNSLTPNESKTFDLNFQMPLYYGTRYLEARVNSPIVITETNYNNNTLTYAVSTSNEADLVILPQDITFLDDDLRVNKTTTTNVKIRNIGAKNANNVTIKAYQTAVNPTNEIASYSFSSISSQGIQEWSFPFTPRIQGADKIIVWADPDNTVIEEDNANNKGEKVFNVLASDVNEGFVGYTFSFDVFTSCVYILDNGDRFVSKGLTDENGTAKLDFLFTDSQGIVFKTINDDEVKGVWSEGKEFNMIGKTLRLLVVNKDRANVLLVYSAKRALAYSNCTLDLEELQRILEQCNREKTGSDNLYHRCQLEFDQKEREFNDVSNERNTLKNALETCEATKSSYETELSNSNNSCTSLINTAKANESNYCVGLLNQKDVEVGYWKKTVDDKQGLINCFFGLVILGFVGGGVFLFYKHKKAIGG